MADVSFDHVVKVFRDGTKAVDDLSLHIEDGEFMVFVGPSGCGKTTALRMVAGLEDVTAGELRIGGDLANGLDPRKRDVAMVFQNYALYPHMTVFENIAFPLRSVRLPREEIQSRVARVASTLGLDSLLSRKPGMLSGGQRQRVAMGRAIIREPRASLMDEPLSNLDAKLRSQMRAEISRLQQEMRTTTIYVTHDQIEAMTMGSRVSVMRRGVLQQIGPPQELFESPANLFVASFIGSPAMNLMRAQLVQGADDEVVCVAGTQRWPVPATITRSRDRLQAHIGRDLALGVRPDYLGHAADGQDGDFPVEGTVALVEILGSDQLLHLQVPGEPVVTDEVREVADDTDAAVVQTLERVAEDSQVRMISRVSSESRVRAGDTIRLSASPRHLHFFDLETGLAL